MLPFQDPAIDGAEAHNIRCMFVAGLSEGTGKPTLLLCPNSFSAPLDIKDEITPFKTPQDISNAVADFCPLIAEYASKVEPSGIDTQTLLEALSIGEATLPLTLFGFDIQRNAFGSIGANQLVL